jgi:hypothetical protein
VPEADGKPAAARRPLSCQDLTSFGYALLCKKPAKGRRSVLVPLAGLLKIQSGRQQWGPQEDVGSLVCAAASMETLSVHTQTMRERFKKPGHS